MKKLLSFCLLAPGLMLVSCGGGGGMSSKAKKNLEVNTAITKAYMAGDFSKMGDYITADAVDHGGEKGDIKGLDSIVAMMKVYHGMMTDMSYKVIKELADDEYVFSWTTVSGKMSGQQMNMASLDVSKFKDGKVTEHWVFMDPREVAQMMQGMQPPPGPPAGVTDIPVADTTKK